jgi:preprotein translocase subunit SecY
MTPDLGRRIAFTIGALLVYRLGTHIPLPGMSAPAWASLYRSTGGGVLAMFSTLSGGAAGRLAIFALGIVPYFSAAFLLQVVMIFSARFKAFAWRGYAGRNAIVRYTRYLAVVLAAFQAYGIAVAFEAVPSLVSDPGPLFRISTVVTLTGGTVFLIWLSDQITQRGIGNGLALILFVGIALEFPSAVASTLELGRPGALAPKMIVAWGLIVIGLIALIAFVERARRHVPLSYAAAPADGYAVTGRAVLRLKLNNAGLMPSLLASWLITTTITGSFLIVGAQTEWWNAVAGALLPGRPWFMLVYGALIVICIRLHGLRARSGRSRCRPAEAGRCRGRPSSGRANGPTPRQPRFADDRCGNALSALRVPRTGVPGRLRGASVLSGWDIVADCGLYGVGYPGSGARYAVRSGAGSRSRRSGWRTDQDLGG